MILISPNYILGAFIFYLKLTKEKLKHYNKTTVYDIVTCIAAEIFLTLKGKLLSVAVPNSALKKIQSMRSLINVNTKGVAIRSSTE